MKLPAFRGFAGAITSLELRILPSLRRAADEPHLASVRKAIQPAFAALILATAVAFFVVPRHQVLARFFDAYHVGFGAMGVALAALLGERLARTFHHDRVVGVLLSLGAFYVSLPQPESKNVIEALGTLSSTSIFLGLVVALVTGEILRATHERVRTPVVATSIAAVVSAILFGGLAAAHLSIASALLAAIKPLVNVGDTLPALLIVILLQTLLWSAGVHGPAFLSAVVTPVYLHAIDQNSQAVLHHVPPPHIVTIMLFTFFFPGGSGATLALSVMMLRSKVARLRKIGYASFFPSLANVNEPLIFGIPLVMNPSLVIPFIGVPLLLGTLTYVVMWLGLVPKTVVWLPGMVPSFVAAWLTTQGSWRAVALVVANILIAFVCYMPFFRNFEETISKEPESEESLVQAARSLRVQQRSS